MEIRKNQETGLYDAIAEDGTVIFSNKYKCYAKKRAEQLLADGKVPTNAPVRKVAPAVKFSVTERFEFIEAFVEMVANAAIPSMIITGPGGLGKSYTVSETLAELGLDEVTADNPAGDYIVIKGYSTPKALYRTLYDYNGKIIVFDDADSIHKDAIGANILKGALDSNERRIISWGAETRGEDDLPSRFEFTGQVIFISNLLIAKFPQPLLSRSVKVDLDMTAAEKVERIEFVLNKQEDKAGVKDTLDFVKEHADKFTDLNIRSAMSILTIRRNAGKNWKRLALYNAVA